MRPLAIIENDVWFAARLQQAIEAAGFRAELFGAARRALPLLIERMYALAIIDLAVDDIDPFAVCRDASPFVPLIVVTPHDAPDECARAIEAGADDCICRPLVERELIARVRNVLRRADEGMIEHGDLGTALAEMRVHVGDEVHDLTSGEAAVLGALLDHAPTPMTVLDIARALGARRGTVESRIKSLRRKLGRGRLVSRGRLGYQLE